MRATVGKISDWEDHLEVWTKKFRSPAVEVIITRDYTDSPEGIDQATVFKLKNGKYAFVKEYAPDENYDYGDAVVHTNLSKEKAEQYMNKYIEDHEHRMDAWDEMVEEILNEFIKR